MGYSVLSGLGGAGLGYLIGNALLNAKYAKLPQDYNTCIKEKAKKKRKLKAMIPDNINLGLLPTGNGQQSTTVGLSWKL